MTMTESEYWLFTFAGLIAVLIVVESIRRFFKSKPCWLFGHDRKHLSIEFRVWTGSYGNCGRDSHTYHYGNLCYVTKWICAKTKCRTMGVFCVGEKGKGAWTIRNEEVVPDEKEWMKWDK